MKKRRRTLMIGASSLAAYLALGACSVLSHPKFGRLPSRLSPGRQAAVPDPPEFDEFPQGGRLEAIEKSPNYRDGVFRNLTPTPTLVDDRNFFSVFVSNLFVKKERLRPDAAIPSVKTDLKVLDQNEDTVIWLGHSSYFVRLGGKTILIDPVFSDYAAPFSFINKAFAGANIYTAGDMPPIDYLLVSHDHWDHLDYPSMTALNPKVGAVVCGLGVGAHLEHWGYARGKIKEADWYAALRLEEGFCIHVLPARHFSGRWLTRNKTLWAGFALETPKRRIFFSGDSGYGPHFSEIARRFSGFDLAILENGQYDRQWAYIHMMPEEVARVAEELRAKALLPAHGGKFCIANHAWDEPFKRLAEASRGKSYRLLTPKIGEPVKLDDPQQRFPPWWEGIG